jgi:hypothetical protein
MNINIENKKESELKSLETILSQLNDKSIAVKISNDNELSTATELLKTVKERIKIIEERRTDLVKPLNDYVKNLNAEFKPYKEKAEEIKKLLETEILRYNRIREEKLREEAEKKRQEELAKLKEEEEKARLLNEVFDDSTQEKLAETLKRQQEKLENKEIEISTAIKTNKATTTTRKQWAYEIEDENKVPREFCNPDHYKIQIAIKNGIREIAGLKIYEKEILVTK